MERFKIYDGRTSFWQWDLEQKIVVPDGIADEVHFSNEKHDQAPVCEVYELDGVRLVNVPNIMLQDALPLTVYAYAKDDKGERTTYADVFTVTPRAKPEDYVYTETEVKTWDALDERITKLENSGGVDPEAVKDAVEDYLAENPITETDPTVPEWAKQPNKPTYTPEEIGAQPAGDYALKSEIPEIPTTLPNPHKLTFTGAVSAEYDGSEAVEVNIPEGGSGGGGIPVPETAEVGQTIVVKAVDENGKPTEWEAADVPSGVGGSTYTTLWQGTATNGSTITLSDSIRNYKQIIVVAGISGKAMYQFTGVFSPEHTPISGQRQWYLNTPFQVDTSNGVITAICTAVITMNGDDFMAFASTKTMVWTSAALFAVIGVN